MKLFRGITLLLFTPSLFVYAQQNAKSPEQLQTLADEARASGDLQAETDAVCQQAALNPGKYGKRCEHLHSNLNKALAQFHADLATSRFEMQQGDFPGATRDLSKIAYGPDRAEAQYLLGYTRRGVLPPTPEQLSQKALELARAAFEKGDFSSAEAAAKRVDTDPLRAAAVQLINNIRSYRQAMTDAAAMEQNGDLKGAEQRLTVAIGILPQGPGAPQAHLAQVRAEEEAVEAKAQQEASELLREQQAAANAKKKSVARTKSGVAVQSAHTGADRPGAKTAEKASLGAKAPAKDAPGNDSPELHAEITSGIQAFYATQLENAEHALRGYLEGGDHAYGGAAHFYLGACLLMESYVAGDEDDARKQQAEAEFDSARHLHYQPVRSAVSPRILAEWDRGAKNG